MPKMNDLMKDSPVPSVKEKEPDNPKISKSEMKRLTIQTGMTPTALHEAFLNAQKLRRG